MWLPWTLALHVGEQPKGQWVCIQHGGLLLSCGVRSSISMRSPPYSARQRVGSHKSCDLLVVHCRGENQL